MTLLVGVDNPGSKDPRFALEPYCPGRAGWHMVKLIGEIVPGYTAIDYLADFDRVCLYPTGHARNGKGKIHIDRAMADWCFLLAVSMQQPDIVLLGLRVRAAFDHIVTLPDKDVAIAKFDGIRIHSIPHPGARGQFYTDQSIRTQVGIRLASLRRFNLDPTESLPRRQAN